MTPEAPMTNTIITPMTMSSVLNVIGKIDDVCVDAGDEVWEGNVLGEEADKLVGASFMSG